jgi:DDE family transposase
MRCKIQSQHFTRNRSLPFTSLVVFMINFVKRSLQLELYSFADFFNMPSVTKQAFSQARQKLSPEVFRLLNDRLLKEFYTDNVIQTFKGLRLLAVDGSILRLPIADQLYQLFGSKRHNGSDVPLARASVLFDVLNHLTLHSIVDRYDSSERDIAAKHISYLSNTTADNQCFEDLLLFDRGYPSKILIFMLRMQNKHFLMRVSQHFITETNQMIAANISDAIITVKAFGDNKKVNANVRKALPHLQQNTTLRLRFLAFDMSNGKKEYILTSLIDQTRFNSCDIFTMYNKRWNIEECYKFYKSIAEIENFSGKSELAIKQDFYSTVFSCNIASILMQEAQDEINAEQEKIINEMQSKQHNKYSYKINRNMLIGIIKNEIINILMGDQNLEQYCEKLKLRIKKNLIPIRLNRSYPRYSVHRMQKSINKRAL